MNYELIQCCTNCGILVAMKWRENEEMERECGNGERMRKWREIGSTFPHFLSISQKSPNFACKSKISPQYLDAKAKSQVPNF